ncbi:MAG: ornithine carbamoyltransferase [Nitrospinae bacterium]|nr:ornithine carbamoyltransferase [Nitrospinota bacterium]
MKRDLLRLTDLTREEIGWLLRATARLKEERKKGIAHPHLAGKSLGMIFYKSSTRTRVSFEVGMVQLGGHPVVLDGRQLQMNRGETVGDTAKIFSRYLDALVIRTYAQDEVEELAREASIPVINALTDMYHPCQILTDIFTIAEKRGSLDGVKVAYIGDGNNVTHSWLLGSAILGLNLAVATPTGYEPDAGVVDTALGIARGSGAKIELGNDPAAAASGADVIYTDTWISMGQDEEAAARRKAFHGYCVDEALVARAKKDALVMHCLPAHRGEEISAGVMDGPRSVVWDEAENRLHTQKAILLFLLRPGARELYS